MNVYSVCIVFVLNSLSALSYAAPLQIAEQISANKPGENFDRTEFHASPPVDLSKPPVNLPEAIPIHEGQQELVSADTNSNEKLQVSDVEWEEFKKKFNKSYSDSKEEEYRRDLYSQKKKYVQEHNNMFEAGIVSYSVELNQFSDRGQEEKFHTGLIRPSNRTKLTTITKITH